MTMIQSEIAEVAAVKGEDLIFGLSRDCKSITVVATASGGRAIGFELSVDVVRALAQKLLECANAVEPLN